MSASKDKLNRASQRVAGTEKHLVARNKEQKKHKTRLIRGIIIGALVVIILAASFLITSSLFANMTAVTISGPNFTQDFSMAEFNYFYFSAYRSTLNQLGNYASMLGLDPSKPLNQQAYSGDSSGQTTWADYFKTSALNQMQTVAILVHAANADGVTLSDTGKTNIETQITSLKASATSNGYTNFDQFLNYLYGGHNGHFNEKNLRDILAMTGLASEYSNSKLTSFTFTQDQLDQYYSDNKDTLDRYNFRAYFVSGAADAANGIDAATAMANAKTTADTIVSGVTGDDVTAKETSFNDLVYANAPDASKSTYQDGGGTLNSNVAGSSVSSTYSSWLFDSARQPGDVTSIASDTGYYVVFFLSREDNHYNLRMARHILFKATASADGTFTDDAKSAAQAQAQSMLDQWKAGDATEDSFAALANANSQDPGSNTNGGLYDQIYKGEMASKFDAWVFDPGRQPGDTGIVYVEGGSSTNSYAGYSVIYYVGESDMLYSTLLATNAMQSNSYNDWMTGQSDGVTTVTHSLPMFFSK